MSSAAMPDPMASRLGYALKRAHHALRARMDEALRPTGITMPQYAVLSAIELDSGLSSARLSRAAFVTPQTMHGLLTNLQRGGLLLREPDPEHGRILRNRLTPEGSAVLAEAHRVVAQVEAIMIATVGEAQASVMAQTLSRCAERLDDRPGNDAGAGK